MNKTVRSNLQESYDRHARERDARGITSWKAREREAFLAHLQAEQKESLLEIGAGTGIDGKFFQKRGLKVVCTDLSAEMVAICREKGLTAHRMDFADLRFPPRSFDAVYSLNCLLHAPREELRRVLCGIHRLLREDGLFYLRLYGGYDHEGIWQEDSYEPKRFFSFHSDKALEATVGEIFEILSFKKVEVEENSEGLHFQSLVLRKGEDGG